VSANTRREEIISSCTCGNQACAVRVAWGLRPFCQIPASNAKREGFGSYSEAAAACKPGQRVKSLGQYLNGGPRRFIVVGVA